MTDEPRSPRERVVDLFSRRLIEQARKIVAQVQGTMALEGQGLDKEQIDDMIERTCQELLTDERSEE